MCCSAYEHSWVTVVLTYLFQLYDDCRLFSLVVVLTQNWCGWEPLVESRSVTYYAELPG